MTTPARDKAVATARNDPKGRPRFIENKNVDHSVIQDLLAHSAKANQWSNFGPLSSRLEARIAELLDLPDALCVVACCNATVALHALVDMQEVLLGRRLRWVTSSFGFYSSCDGVLRDAVIVDSDADGMLDLDLLNPDDFDGLIVTNIFGRYQELERYTRFAEAHQKILVVDSAMGFQMGGHLANSCISLHHTKPWGFGEGGCAIVNRAQASLFREMISFGHSSPDSKINRLAVNGKISEVACAYLLMRLEETPKFRDDYRREYHRIASIGVGMGLNLLGGKAEHPGIPGNVPFLLPTVVKVDPDPVVPARKYYFPLSNTPVAADIYRRIVNVACHSEMSEFSNLMIEEFLAGLINEV